MNVEGRQPRRTADRAIGQIAKFLVVVGISAGAFSGCESRLTQAEDPAPQKTAAKDSSNKIFVPEGGLYTDSYYNNNLDDPRIFERKLIMNSVEAAYKVKCAGGEKPSVWVRPGVTEFAPGDIVATCANGIPGNIDEAIAPIEFVPAE